MTNLNESALNAPVMGRQSPSVEHLPAEIGTTALADECVDYVQACGMELDPWQQHCLRMSLSEVERDLWAAFLVGIIVGRQNGKGTLLEAREIAGLFYVGESLILHSAHEFKTCYEHFLRITQFIESVPELDKKVAKIRRGVGEQAVELRNGNRLRFIARSSGSGRGMSAPCVVLDEAMFLTEAQIGAIMPTLSAQANPQLWFTSSAPLSTSVALHRLRKSAIEGTGDRLFYAEWGNDPGVDHYDEQAIARANPALGRRLFIDFIETEREAMAPEEFARERLGVPEAPESTAGPIALDRWNDLIDADAMPEPHTVRLAIDCPPDRTSATFAVAGKMSNGLLFVEQRWHLAPQQMGDLVRRAAELADGHDTKLIVPPGSPALAWKAELLAAGVPLDEMTPAEYAAACGYMSAAIGEGKVRHTGQPELRNAIAGLSTRSTGDVEVWARRTSSVNIAPFVAATCALARVPEEAKKVADPSFAFA